jgi:hypothetical protein
MLRPRAPLRFGKRFCQRLDFLSTAQQVGSRLAAFEVLLGEDDESLLGCRDFDGMAGDTSARYG